MSVRVRERRRQRRRVDQENNSEAKSEAENENELEQDIDQEQSGGKCCEEKKAEPSYDKSKEAEYEQGKSKDEYPKYEEDDCGCKGIAIQAAGQKAINKQNAEADAESLQIKPSNKNASVRFKSYGDDGDVSQENNSYADADAGNDNDTDQSIEQSQESGDCGCKGGVLIQAAAQTAFNWQDADADAESKQIEPENKALSFRFFSWGDGGELSQANNSEAESEAENENDLEQDLDQAQGG